MERLEDAGLLSGTTDDTEGNYEGSKLQSTGKELSNPGSAVGEGRKFSGTPWFEEMIEGSELGRIKRRRGGGRTSDGKVAVEFEITEFESKDGGGLALGMGKRKLGSLGTEDDVEMRSG